MAICVQSLWNWWLSIIPRLSCDRWQCATRNQDCWKAKFLQEWGKWSNLLYNLAALPQLSQNTFIWLHLQVKVSQAFFDSYSKVCRVDSSPKATRPIMAYYENVHWAHHWICTWPLLQELPEGLSDVLWGENLDESYQRAKPFYINQMIRYLELLETSGPSLHDVDHAGCPSALVDLSLAGFSTTQYGVSASLRSVIILLAVQQINNTQLKVFGSKGPCTPTWWSATCHRSEPHGKIDHIQYISSMFIDILKQM